MSVCFEDDEYVRDIFRWVAVLSDGRTAYGDDDRPGVSPGDSWQRLKAYCLANGLHVEDLTLQFRSHIVPVPYSEEGYYLARTVFGVYGDAECYRGCIVGPVHDGVIKLVEFVIPEIEPIRTEDRKVDPSNPCLFLRSH